jgi:hypothetical protein
MDKLSEHEQTKICSPIMEAWANFDLCTQDLYPHNDFNVPGSRITDACLERIILDASSPVKGKKGAVKKYHEMCKVALEKAFLDASTSADCLAVVCNASVPRWFQPDLCGFLVWRSREIGWLLGLPSLKMLSCMSYSRQ